MPIDEIDEKMLGEAIKARIMKFYAPKEANEGTRQYLMLSFRISLRRVKEVLNILCFSLKEHLMPLQCQAAL